MASFRFRTDFGKAFEAEIKAVNQPIVDASQAALKEAGRIAVTEGRRNIAAGGRFSGRWTQGLTSRFYKNTGLDAAVLIYHKMRIAGVFEEGATITGDPLLWLPIGGRRLLARRGRLTGLASVQRPGKPPLLVGEAQGERVPLFVGVPRVRLRKRFNIAVIVRRAAGRLGEFYHNHIKKV